MHCPRATVVVLLIPRPHIGNVLATFVVKVRAALHGSVVQHVQIGIIGAKNA